MQPIPPRVSEFIVKVKESPVNVEIRVGGIVFTKQQTITLILVSVGFSIKEVGGVMKLSPKTVEKHLERVRHLTGKRTIVALTHFSIQNKLIHAGEHIGNR